ncbi:hypothetical protein [Coraliomargarita parva]|uniref:hypothetical protein n=1 Tax=Coraliomargarita parva TaxID=3014050 RepID=UPI0022B54767|nr:hypothetical protein [Coraliomargarita parva]
MDRSLEELERQRELLRQHLEWLDACIAEARLKPNAPTGTEPAAALSPPEKPQPESLPHQDPTTEAHLNAALEAEAREYKTGWAAMNDVAKAKVGCFVLFGAGILAFLFFLFVLPFLMK